MISLTRQIDKSLVSTTEADGLPCLLSVLVGPRDLNSVLLLVWQVYWPWRLWPACFLLLLIFGSGSGMNIQCDISERRHKSSNSQGTKYKWGLNYTKMKSLVGITTYEMYEASKVLKDKDWTSWGENKNQNKSGSLDTDFRENQGYIPRLKIARHKFDLKEKYIYNFCHLHVTQMLSRRFLKLHLSQPGPQSGHCQCCWQTWRHPSVRNAIRPMLDSENQNTTLGNRWVLRCFSHYFLEEKQHRTVYRWNLAW